MQTVQDLETAFRRALARSEKRNLAKSVQSARNALRAKGWKQVEAAEQIGVSDIHLCYVLNGRRNSRRILQAIEILPNNPHPA